MVNEVHLAEMRYIMEDIYELLNNAEMHLEEFENQKLSDYE